MNPARVRAALPSFAVRLPAGSPRADEAPAPAPNPRGEGTHGIADERHPLKTCAHVFTPRRAAEGRHPLPILPCGGVHGDFTTCRAPIGREPMERGDVVVAPEFRSTRRTSPRRPRGGAIAAVAALAALALPGASPLRAQADGAVDVAAQSGVEAALVEARVAELVDAERARARLSRLAHDPKLADIARRHSRDMAERRFFDHVSPDGKDPARRGRDAGYPCRKSYSSYFTQGLGENIFQSAVFSSVTFGSAGARTYQWMTADEIARQVVEGWMSSEGHRKNVLERRFSHQGIGVAITPGGKVFVTQNLC